MEGAPEQARERQAQSNQHVQAQAGTAPEGIRHPLLKVRQRHQSVRPSFVDWAMDADALEPPSVMTIDELEQEVAALQHLAGEYFRLTRKYERWAVSRQV